MSGGDVAPDGVSLVAVDAAFPLLKVDRVARQVPMNQAMAPEVKVETFLTDGRAGEHERPEGTVEGGSHGVLADVFVILSAKVAKAESKYRANANFLRFDGISVSEMKKTGVDT